MTTFNAILPVADMPVADNNFAMAAADQPSPEPSVPKKKPEVEPEKLPHEDPGIQPDTQPKREGDDDNDDEDDDDDFPLTEPSIGDDPDHEKGKVPIM